MAPAYQHLLKETLIDTDTLQHRIRELGQQISAEYAGQHDLILICILKGGIMFLCDLMRHIDVPHEIDFIAASSYGKGVRSTSGSVRIDMDITTDITGRPVLVVEDIIDSGFTLRFVMDTLLMRNPSSLRLCALLNKASRREVDLVVDYVGFEIENKFVFGYGLDLDEKYRNLPFVGVVNEDALKDE